MQNIRRRRLPPSAARGSAAPEADMTVNGHQDMTAGHMSRIRGPPASATATASNPASGGPMGHRRPQPPAEPIDASSCKGTFGWATIDGVNIPYILRNKTKYVSVRMVELKLLSKYPSTYPEELKDRAPLTSQFITLNEASLLNEINAQHCNFEYGQQGFDGQDLIVILGDFEDFYDIVKRNFPEGSAAPQDSVSEASKSQKQQNASGSASGSTDGGWIQVNNTIVPFVIRRAIKLVPLPVIRYGANLLNNVQVAGLDCTERELTYLNHNCKEIGLDFTFSKSSTKLIEISLIPTLSESKPSIIELPKDDPFSHAMYRSEEEASQSSANYPSAMEGFPRAGQPSGGPPPQLPVASRPVPQAPVPQRMGHMIKGSIPSSLPPSASPAGQNSEPTVNMSWMGPHMGMFPGMPQRGPPPPYKGASRPPHRPPPGMPGIGAGEPRLPRAPRMPHAPLQQPLPSNHPALSPNTISKPPASAESVLDLSAKSPPAVAPEARSSPGCQKNDQGNIKGVAKGPEKTANPRGNQVSQSWRKSGSQHPRSNRTPTHSASASKSNVIKLKDGRSIELQSTSFHGKGITCIVKDGDGFALLESLNRMFFPKCNLEAFTRGLRDVLKLEIKELTEEEEQAFIAHYELRIRNLRCTKVVSLGAMDLNMTQMKFMFNAEEAAEAIPPKPTQKTPEPENQDTNNNTNDNATTPQDPEAKANHLAACQALKNFIGSKRAATSDTDLAPPRVKRAATAGKAQLSAKHATGKLENIMNKLKKAQMKPDESTDLLSQDIEDGRSTPSELQDDSTRESGKEVEGPTTPEQMRQNDSDDIKMMTEETSIENPDSVKGTHEDDNKPSLDTPPETQELMETGDENEEPNIAKDSNSQTTGTDTEMPGCVQGKTDDVADGDDKTEDQPKGDEAPEKSQTTDISKDEPEPVEVKPMDDAQSEDEDVSNLAEGKADEDDSPNSPKAVSADTTDEETIDKEKLKCNNEEESSKSVDTYVEGTAKGCETEAIVSDEDQCSESLEVDMEVVSPDNTKDKTNAEECATNEIASESDVADEHSRDKVEDNEATSKTKAEECETNEIGSESDVAVSHEHSPDKVEDNEATSKTKAEECATNEIASESDVADKVEDSEATSNADAQGLIVDNTQCEVDNEEDDLGLANGSTDSVDDHTDESMSKDTKEVDKVDNGDNDSQQDKDGHSDQLVDEEPSQQDKDGHSDQLVDEEPSEELHEGEKDASG